MQACALSPNSLPVISDEVEGSHAMGRLWVQEATAQQPFRLGWRTPLSQSEPEPGEVPDLFTFTRFLGIRSCLQCPPPAGYTAIGIFESVACGEVREERVRTVRGYGGPWEWVLPRDRRSRVRKHTTRGSPLHAYQSAKLLSASLLPEYWPAPAPCDSELGLPLQID